MLIFKMYIIAFYIFHLYNLFTTEKEKNNNIEEVVEETNEVLSYLSIRAIKILMIVMAVGIMLFSLFFSYSVLMVTRYKGHYVIYIYIILGLYVTYLTTDFVYTICKLVDITQDGLGDLVNGVIKNKSMLFKFVETTLLTMLFAISILL